jgi:acylphosphatase
MITGRENDVNDFIKWCKIGPQNARVKEVIVSKEADTFFEDYEVRRR